MNMETNSGLTNSLYSLFQDRHDSTYTKSYCEENVWMLCKKIKENRPHLLQSCFVVFISNTNRAVPIWHQRARAGPEQPVVWDYHVILVQKNDETGCVVYDQDTQLKFPCGFNEYTGRAIQPDDLLKQDFHRMFRVVSADMYLQTFASNRSHMRHEDKSWIAPPPDYPCIQTKACVNNIQDYISVDPELGLGEVMNTEAFVDKFGSYSHMVDIFMKYYTPMKDNMSESDEEETSGEQTVDYDRGSSSLPDEQKGFRQTNTELLDKTDS